MKISFQNIPQNSFNPVKKLQNKQLSSEENQVSADYTYNIYNYPSFKGCCPHPSSKILNIENAKKIKELESIAALTKDENNVFSIDKAVDLIKNKIDTQLMLYSEEDIKKVVKTVMKENPGTTREEVLNVLARMSSFSNYESFSNLEKVLEKEKVLIFESAQGVMANDVLKYLSHVIKFGFRRTHILSF